MLIFPILKHKKIYKTVYILSYIFFHTYLLLFSIFLKLFIRFSATLKNSFCVFSSSFFISLNISLNVAQQFIFYLLRILCLVLYVIFKIGLFCFPMTSLFSYLYMFSNQPSIKCVEGTKKFSLHSLILFLMMLSLPKRKLLFTRSH